MGGVVGSACRREVNYRYLLFTYIANPFSPTEGDCCTACSAHPGCTVFQRPPFLAHSPHRHASGWRYQWASFNCWLGGGYGLRILQLGYTTGFPGPGPSPASSPVPPSTKPRPTFAPGLPPLHPWAYWTRKWERQGRTPATVPPATRTGPVWRQVRGPSTAPARETGPGLAATTVPLSGSLGG